MTRMRRPSDSPDATPATTPAACIGLWLLIGTSLLSGAACSAELRGRIWDAATGAAPAGGSLELSCGGDPSPNPHPLTGSGAYSIRNVPSGTCKVTVHTSQGRASRTVAINKPVVQFSCETRAVGRKVVLIPR